MTLVPYPVFAELCQNTDDTITLPKAVFKHLVTLALENSSFDEDAYLAKNPDVSAAIRRGSFESAQFHYAHFGYFENRSGAGFEVDDFYYRTINSDVDRAIESGQWASATNHYEKKGIFEWRSPNEAVEDTVASWQALFKSTRDAAGDAENIDVAAE